MGRMSLFLALLTAVACGSPQTNTVSPSSEAAEESADESSEGLDYDPDALVDFDLIWDGKEHLGARFRMAKDWHLYWINPGDSGLPTKVRFDSLPEGLTIDGPYYPGPGRFGSEGDIVNYGYHGELVLPLRLTGTLPDGPTTLVAKASWLACNDEACVPGKAEASITLDAAGTQVDGAAIAKALRHLPQPIDKIAETLAIVQGIPDESGAMELLVHAPKGSKLEIFPLVDEALSEVRLGSIEDHEELRFKLHLAVEERELAVLSVNDDLGTTFYLFDKDGLPSWTGPKE